MTRFCFHVKIFFEFNPKIAGTIRKVAANTLTYSRELSSFFTDYESGSLNSSENEDEEPEPIEFDLRDATEVFGNENVLHDAPVVDSESLISLQAPPSTHKSVRNRHAREQESTRIPTKAAKDISRLVDELVGSPKLPDLTVKINRRGPLGSLSNRISPVSTPLIKMVLPMVNSPIFPVSRRTRTVSPRKMSSWKCPDAWIPNHACDDFCFDSLRGL